MTRSVFCHCGSLVFCFASMIWGCRFNSPRGGPPIIIILLYQQIVLCSLKHERTQCTGSRALQRGPQSKIGERGYQFLGTTARIVQLRNNRPDQRIPRVQRETKKQN